MRARHLCDSTIVPPFISRLLGEGSGKAAPCSEGTFALGVNREPRKGSVPAPPSVLRKVPGVFRAPL